MRLSLELPTSGVITKLYLKGIPANAAFYVGNVELCKLSAGNAVIDFGKMIASVRQKLMDNSALGVKDLMIMALFNVNRARIGYNPSMRRYPRGMIVLDDEPNYLDLLYDFNDIRFHGLNLSEKNTSLYIKTPAKSFTYHLFYHNEHVKTVRAEHIIFPPTGYVDKVIIDNVSLNAHLVCGDKSVCKLTQGTATVDFTAILRQMRQKEQYFANHNRERRIDPMPIQYMPTSGELALLSVSGVLESLMNWTPDWKSPRWSAIDCACANEPNTPLLSVQVRPKIVVKYHSCEFLDVKSI